MTPLKLAHCLAALACLIATSGCATTSLQGGPMAGFSGTTGAAVWLMTEGEARVALQYWPAQQPDRPVLSPEVTTRAETGYTARVELDALTPDTDYRYRMLIDGRPIDGNPPFALRTQPAEPRAPRDFMIAAGSCSHVDAGASAFSSGYAIFDAMAARKPDVMLWLGDHIYYRDEDFGDGHRERMQQSWQETRAFPALQKLLGTGHHYGIWDDHDYGPNNSNRSFALKSDALDTFRRYFANPAYGLPDLPGVFFKTSFEDVDLFMLDDRYYRDDDDAEHADKTMLGHSQLEWLKRELETSKATFKLIANGSRMLSDRPTPEKRGGEGWHNFPAERAAFLEWLKVKRIDGVFCSPATSTTPTSRSANALAPTR